MIPAFRDAVARLSTVQIPCSVWGVIAVIVPRTTREKILVKLRKKVESRVPVLISSAASGLVARMLEEAGADCVNTFHGARLRANGLGTMAMLWPIVNANEQVFKNTQEDVLPAMKGDAFVCMCINANDPLRDMHAFLEQIKALGVMSVSNIGPSVSYIDHDSNIYKVLRKCGVTLENEIEMLALAKQELNMVTIGVAFTEEDSLQMIEGARPDLFCYHAGTTKGGRRGYDSGETIEETAARTKEVNEKAKKIMPELITIAHGAAMETPEEAQFMLDHAACEGIWTGSSTERLPIEKAVFEAGKKFASLRYSN
jgi:predicted TIM-barrel enzyme